MVSQAVGYLINREAKALIKLLFFGRLGDFSENTELVVDCSEIGFTPNKVRSLLSEDNENLGKELAKPHVIVAVNKVIVRWDDALSNGDELAFLPPVTGG